MLAAALLFGQLLDWKSGRRKPSPGGERRTIRDASAKQSLTSWPIRPLKELLLRGDLPRGWRPYGRAPSRVLRWAGLSVGGWPREKGDEASYTALNIIPHTTYCRYLPACLPAAA